MTEEAYAKFNNGKYHFSYDNKGMSFKDEFNNNIEQINGVFV